jgi:hypothetical protein
VAHKLVNNRFNVGTYNNYLLGGNLCNAFALGSVGAADDFFLIGAEPPDESSYPSLTGNVLDSEGQLLFRLVRNVLVVNPGNCSKVLGDHLGYEIHDSAGKLIFRVRTAFSADTGFTTTIDANFYSKDKALVFQATAGELGEKIEASVRCAFGFSGGGFGMVIGYSPAEMEVVRVALATNASVYELLSGQISERALSLDGKYIRDANITKCKLIVETGRFVAGPNSSFSACEFEFRGPARQVADIVAGLMRQSVPGKPIKPLQRTGLRPAAERQGVRPT